AVLSVLRSPNTLFTLSLTILSFFFNDPATTQIYTLSLHDALPIYEFRQNARETADMFERVGIETAAETYGRGPSRLRFEQKDPHGFAEIVAQLKTHSTLGSAMTMRGVQGTRKTVYEVADQLPSLQVPTLVIAGDEDELALEPSLLMKRKIPNSGLLIVP